MAHWPVIGLEIALELTFMFIKTLRNWSVFILKDKVRGSSQKQKGLFFVFLLS